MKLKQTLIAFLIAIGTVQVLVPSSLYAADSSCGVQTSIISCSGVKDDGTAEHSAVWSLLLTAINILTAGVGVAAVGGIVYGSILYASAGGSPDGVKKAREIITNVVIGIAAYILMYALLNFLIPGGLFN